MKPMLRFKVGMLSMNFMSPRHLAFLLLPVLAGCIHVKMDPIQVHATVDVNVKVDRALDDFFADLDKKSTTIAQP